MLTNRAALAALAVVGVVAAGSGAYIASRQHPVPEGRSASIPDVNLASGSGTVTETENSLAPAPVPAPVAPVTSEVAVKPAAPPRPASSTASRSRTPQVAERNWPAYSQSASASASSIGPSGAFAGHHGR